MCDTKGIRKRNGQIVRISSWFESLGIIPEKKTLGVCGYLACLGFLMSAIV